MSRKTIIRCVKWIFAIVFILYASLELVDYGTKLYYMIACKGTQWYPERIERITGIRVPHCEVINQYVSRLCIEEDSVKFYTIPPSDVFDEIDKRISAGDTCWTRKGNLYSFRLWWDNKCSPPKGEYYKGDFQIRLTKGGYNCKNHILGL